MLKNVKYTLFLFFFVFGMPIHAFNLDETVDDDIRKNYNSTKLIEDVKVNNSQTENELPKLPNILNKNTSVVNSQAPVQQVNYVSNAGRHKINKHTKFIVVNNNAISDGQTEGTKITFKTQRAIRLSNYILPTGTIFYGEVVDSHTPQITCNGGLVVINIYAMKSRTGTVPVNAYITKANGKYIFFENIKGQRTYLKTVHKKGAWGRKMFNKMWKITLDLGKDGSTIILTPFPLLYGTMCFGANAVVAPVTAIFSKGGRIYIPAGSTFYIKTEEDVYVD